MSWGANLAIEILEEFVSMIEPVREWREQLFDYRREQYLEAARERARKNAKLPHVKKRRREYLAIRPKNLKPVFEDSKWH